MSSPRVSSSQSFSSGIYFELPTTFQFRANDESVINIEPPEESGFEPPVIINKTKEYGNGAFAKVYAGVMRDMGVSVAVKSVSLSGLSEAQKSKTEQHCKREAAIMTLLTNGNPANVMTLIDAYVNPIDSTYNFIMPVANKGCLTAWLSDEWVLSEASQMSISLGITQGVKYIHQMRVLHRDLKPDNVVLDDEFKPKIIDFGFSIRVGIDEPGQGVLGSPLYSSPEIVAAMTNNSNFTRYTEFTDIYSLGLVIFNIFARSMPNNECNTMQKLKAKIYDRKELPNHPKQKQWPDSIKKAINHCLMFEAERRCTAVQVVDYLSGGKSEIENQIQFKK